MPASIVIMYTNARTILDNRIWHNKKITSYFQWYSSREKLYAYWKILINYIFLTKY